MQTGTSAPILSVNRTETYGYDDLDRLTSVSYGDSETQGYGFDAMGNRLTKSDTVIPSGGGNATTTNTGYSYDAANRLTGVSTNGGTATPVTFDADGNTLSDSGGRTYAWDSENRMTSCTLPNGGGTTTFTYGSDGLRRSMTAGGVTTRYCYDGTHLIREMQTVSGSLTPTASYLEGPRGTEYRRNDLTGVVKWYVYDGLGSVVGEVGPSCSGKCHRALKPNGWHPKPPSGNQLYRPYKSSSTFA